MVVIVVEGIPKPQPRVKACIRGAHAGTYDPGSAARWKACVAIAAMPHRPAVPSESPFAVRLVVFLPRPKRLCRRKDPPHEMLATTAGDCDNYAKSILDCLTDIGWWRDDRQVAVLIVRKLYHAVGNRPGAEITIEELSPAEEPATKSPRGAGGGRHSTAPVQASRGPGIHAEVVGAAAPPSAAASAHSPTRKVTNEQ